MSKPVFEEIFSFSGRRNRKSFALLNLVVMVTSLVIGFIFASIPNVNEAVALIYLISLVPLSWITFAAYSQRFHDIGWSGLWVFGLMIPVVSLIIIAAAFFVRGTSGTNQNGDDPCMQNKV